MKKEKLGLGDAMLDPHSKVVCDDGLSINADNSVDSTNSKVVTISPDEYAELLAAQKLVAKRRLNTKPFVTWKYVLGDVYRLCLAFDKQQAMLRFGCHDPLRVDFVASTPEFNLDLFRPHTILHAPDGSIVLEFPFK